MCVWSSSLIDYMRAYAYERYISEIVMIKATWVCVFSLFFVVLDGTA